MDYSQSTHEHGIVCLHNRLHTRLVPALRGMWRTLKRQAKVFSHGQTLLSMKGILLVIAVMAQVIVLNFNIRSILQECFALIGNTVPRAEIYFFKHIFILLSERNVFLYSS